MPDFARSEHAGVQAQLDRLANLSPAGDRLGLDRISRLLEVLGRPQDSLPPLFHVAGTNGKGSTCAFLRAALEAAGSTVHVFTSPHLVRFNERIRLAGKLIADDQLAALLEEVLDASGGIEPSFFEVTTAAAFLAFARSPADACVVEVGLGGRLDATNVVDRPLVTAIAALGHDHRQFLGNRLADIAAEKAGIAKRDVPLVTQLYHPSAAARVEQAAREAGAIWLPRGEAWDATIGEGRLRYRDAHGELSLALPRLPGRFQAMNAALAVAILRHQQAIHVGASALSAGIARANWPARMQKLEDGPLARQSPAAEIWVDGGHNPSAARSVARLVRKLFDDGRPLHLVFASLTSKNPRGTLRPFVGLAEAVQAVPVPEHEHFEPGELADLGRSLGFQVSAHGELGDALRAVPEGARVLIFGSLYVAGQALAENGQIPD